MIDARHNAVVSAGVHRLHQHYQDRDITPVEGVDIYLARIARLNSGLNIVVGLDEHGARMAAALSGERWAKGKPLGLLDGAPLLVKVNIAVRGLPWTAALSFLKTQVAPKDAFAIDRLRRAGAVILGVVNMHEAALGATTVSPLYGPCMNPLRAGYTPGGSSGGSAAAVAAGFCVAAIGTDTMGSVRIPSAYCGVTGYKPSAGLISRSGVIPLSRTLDHLGVHARDVDGAAAVAKVMMAHDDNDEASIRGKVESSVAVDSLRGVRVGLLDAAQTVACEPRVHAAFAAALNAAKENGARIDERCDIEVDLAALRRQGLLICEAELQAFFGAELQGDGAVSPTLKSMLEYAQTQSAVKLAMAEAFFARVRRAVRTWFSRFDILVSPSAPQTAFAHSETAPASQADFTVLANVLGAPAISIPLPSARDQLPIGLQIIAAPGKDAYAIAVAKVWSMALRADYSAAGMERGDVRGK
jgi:aspartyl-tRNA(Asn)/glutamyl-tRNA(Gln) amidotransferase subunit A